MIYLVDDDGGTATALTDEQAAAFETVGFKRVTLEEYRQTETEQSQAAREYLEKLRRGEIDHGNGIHVDYFKD